MKKIQSFKGIIVFDNEDKRFWTAKEIKDLARTFWKEAGMPLHPSNRDLSWIFRQEFEAYVHCPTTEEIKDGTAEFGLTFWDDGGRWQIMEAPLNIGFGIIDDNDHRLIMEKLSKVM